MLYRRTNPAGRNIKVAILEDRQLAIDGHLFQLQAAPGLEIAGIVTVYSEWAPLSRQSGILRRVAATQRLLSDLAKREGRWAEADRNMPRRSIW